MAYDEYQGPRIEDRATLEDRNLFLLEAVATLALQACNLAGDSLRGPAVAHELGVALHKLETFWMRYPEMRPRNRP